MAIRTRILIVVNALATAVAVIVGWRSIAVVSAAVERRLVEDSVGNAAKLISRMRLPVSDQLMHQLGQILECGIAATPVGAGQLTASNLSPEAAAAVEHQIAAGDRPLERHIRLPDGVHRVATADIRWTAPPPGSARQPMRLLLFMPEARLSSAKRHAAWQIVIITVSAVGLATVLGFWLTSALSHPIRDLARRMDTMASRMANESVSAVAAPRVDDTHTPRVPTEVARLAIAFDHLLDRLQDAQTRLDRAARLAAAGQMSAAVAHELRNPLSGIKMNARLLLDEEGLSDDGRTSVALIAREIDRLDLFLEELMALREPDPGGRPDEPPAPACLADMVDGVTHLFADRARHAGVTVAWDQSGHPATVPMAPERLRQVILNLVANALEATPPGGTVRIEIGEGDVGRVRLWVTDSGPGVDAAVADTLFEPFVTTKQRGAGLGLYICSRIMDGGGGRLGCDTSAPGGRFWLELPGGQAT